jgi:ribosomal protein S18 acetylase RimI-like enzyme
MNNPLFSSMSNLAFSVASDLDQATIAEILEEGREWLQQVKGINQWPFPFTPAWVNKHLEKQEFFLVTLDNVPVAVFRLLSTDPFIWGEDSEDAMYIHSLAVRRSCKGHGIGHRLLQWVEDYTAQQNRPYVRLDCMAENLALCQYYEQAGFIARGAREIPVGEFLYKAQLYEKAVRDYSATE